MLKKITFYFILLTSLTFLLRFVIYIGIRSNNAGMFDKFNAMFIEKDYHEVLFIGSSRAECHFNPAIFDSITSLKSYNIGISGSNNSFTYGIFKSYLANRKAPKIVIMNIDFHLAHESSDTIYEFPRFFPYLQNDILYDELVKRDPRFFAFKYIPFYSLPFVGEKYLNCAIRGYKNEASIYDKTCFKGFQYINPIEYKKINKSDTVSYTATILKENLDYLDSIISVCKFNGSKLYFVVSPAHEIVAKRIKNFKKHIGEFESKAKGSAITFMSYANDSICSQDELFADLYHMKKSGADLFTTKFAIDFKTILQTK